MKEKTMPEPVSLDIRYEEVGRNYRFFLSWRQASFAAMVIAISTGMSLLISSLDSGGKELGFIPLIIAVGEFAFLMVDFRTRQLYRSLVETGVELEKAIHLREGVVPKIGPYIGIFNSKGHKRELGKWEIFWKAFFSFDHSATVNWFCTVSIVGLLGMSTFLFFFKEAVAKNPTKLEVSGIQRTSRDTVRIEFGGLPLKVQQSLIENEIGKMEVEKDSSVRNRY